MFELAWPWIFLLAPLPWLLRVLLPPADSGEAALKVSFLGELETLAGRRARANLPAWRQQAPFALLWLLLLCAAARPSGSASRSRCRPAAATCWWQWMCPAPWITPTCSWTASRSAAWRWCNT